MVGPRDLNSRTNSEYSAQSDREWCDGGVGGDVVIHPHSAAFAREEGYSPDNGECGGPISSRSREKVNRIENEPSAARASARSRNLAPRQAECTRKNLSWNSFLRAITPSD